MGAKPQTIERQTQATPFANDFLAHLRGELSGGFGTGVGPMQREAGTAIRQFINSGGPSLNFTPMDMPTLPEMGAMPGMGPGLEEMLPALEAAHRRSVGRNVADLREGAGIMGTRMGTSLATGEGRMREGMEGDWQAALQGIARQIAGDNLNRFQVGEGANLARFGADTNARLGFGGLDLQRAGLELGADQTERGMQLAAIGKMFGMGGESLAPFLQMAQMGILPPELFVQENPWMQLLTGGLGAAGNVGAHWAGARAGRV